MTDRERKEKQLRSLIKHAHSENNDFVYIPVGDAKTIVRLLEEKKPVRSELEGGGSTWWIICGECHGAIDMMDHYCKHCGREIIRETIYMK